MKVLLIAFSILFFTSCQKELQITAILEVGNSAVASNALIPIKYHAVSFVTNYPVIKGQVPPFSFTKTLYPDSRVKTLHMVSRFDANTKYSTNQYYIHDYTFTYSTNASHAKGTRKLYNAKTGALVHIYNDDLYFTFNSNGGCILIKLGTAPITENNPALFKYLGDWVEDFEFNTRDYGFMCYKDAKGNVTSCVGAWMGGYANSMSYTYDLSTTPKGQLFYVPTQYVMDEWYSLLEAMQWTPNRLQNPRKSVSLILTHLAYEGGGTGDEIIRTYQGQKYLNHKYDVNGNLISYTYGDGVLQKITWK